MKTFFISDLHFSHKNAISFDHRPWETIREMDEEMIKRWNDTVGIDDTVYILGDFCWRDGEKAISIIKQLHGVLHLIQGNHDRRSEEYDKLFCSIAPYADICIELETGEPKRVILSHYFIPLYNGARHNGVMLHGHSHANREWKHEEHIKEYLNDNGIRCVAYNVGAMHLNYTPATLETILSTKKYEKNDKRVDMMAED